MAEALKAAGNAALQAGDFEEAIKKYTEALEQDPNNHVLYSNRSAAYCSSNKFVEAEADARKCVSILPSFVKGYGRIGAALYGQQKYGEALTAYQEGLKIDNSVQSLRDGMMQAVQAMQEQRSNPLAALSGAFTKDIWPKLHAHPRTSELCKDPEFVALIEGVIADPSTLMSHITDPRIRTVLQAILGLDVKMGPGKGGEGGAGESAPAPAPAPAPKKAPPPTPEETGPQAEARVHKEKGNALYKAKDFDAAIAEYEEAQKLDPTNAVYLLNIATAQYEAKRFPECIATADKAFEVAQENRNGFPMMAKCQVRRGMAQEATGDLEAAITSYRRALTDHRTPETLDKLNKCERAKKKRDEDAYLNPELAVAAKERGNEAYKAGKYPQAVEEYSEAIKRDPASPVYWLNRAQAYTKLAALDEAMKDCMQALKLDPNSTKGMLRMANIYTARKEYHKAVEWYEKCIKQDPNNDEAIEGLSRTRALIMSACGEGGEKDEERTQRAMQDPEIQAILSDTYMQSVLHHMSTDPTAMRDYMRSPDIAAKLQKLIAAGVVGTRPAR